MLVGLSTSWTDNESGAGMIDTLGPTATVQQAPSVQRRRLRWFFPSVSAALLSALLVGFTPTFFLQPI
jgi:hypothetical protein